MSDENARIGLAIGGAAIGAYFGVPGVGLAIGTLAGTLLFPGKDPPPVLGPRLDELLQQTSTYGKFIPNIEGSFRVAGNIIDALDIKEVPNSESSGGGKGGPPKQESIGFSYFFTFQVQLCEGPITGIRRIWMNDQFYTDLTAPVPSAPLNIRIYAGTETQLPDPTFEAERGVGQVPAYRGTACAVIIDFPLARSQNAPPVLHFEVVVQGSSAVITTLVADSGGTVGPASIAIDPETNLVWAARASIDELRVFDCSNGLTLIKTLVHDAVTAVAWCPGFLSVRKTLIGNNFIENPPRMWTAAGTPDAFGNNMIGYSTDGAYSSLIQISPFGGSFFCWPGAMIVDKSSVLTQFPNQNAVTVGLVAVTNGACGGMRAFQLDDTIPKNSETFVGYNFISGSYVADMVEGEQDIIYVITFRSEVFKMKKGVPNFPDPTAIFLAVEYFIQDQASAVADSFSFFGTNNHIAFDPDEKSVYTTGLRSSGASVDVRKFDSQLDLIWSVRYTNTGAGQFIPQAIKYHEGTGDIWMFGRGSINGVGVGNTHAVRISSVDGRVLDDLITDVNLNIGGVVLVPGAPLAIATTAAGVLKIPLVFGATPTPPLLRDVLTRYCLRSKDLTLTQIDVSQVPITDTVDGYAIPTRMPISNAMKLLLTAYFVDIVEIDEKVVFKKRGSLSILRIPKEDLSARGFGQALPSPTTSSRTQDNELPRQLDIRFTNGDDEYKLGTVLSHRLTTGSNQIRTIDMPIVFVPGIIQRIVDTLLFNTWNDRDPIDIIISRKYLQIVPTDVITIEHPEIGDITVRVNRVEYHFPQILKVQATIEDITVYSGFTFPAPVTDAIQEVFPPEGNLRMFVLDLPPLRDNDHNTGVYIGGYGISGNFQVGEVYRSPNGSDYDAVSVISNESTVAAAEEILTWDGSFK